MQCNPNTVEQRVKAFSTALAKVTTKLHATDRAAYKALVAAGQDIIARMRGGSL